MGTDKALVEFNGRPLVVHALGILREAGLAASIVGGSPALKAFAPLVEDAKPGLGPLGGICAAMGSTAARWSVFVPVDLPLLPCTLVQYLVNKALVTGRAITITSVTGFLETFPVLLEGSVLPFLESELNSGRGGCFSAFQAAAAALGQPVGVVSADLLAQTGSVAHPGGLPPESWFLNVNSAEDLRRAEALLPNGMSGPGSHRVS